MKTVRWGILATGGIAGSLAQALTDQPDADLLAVGSRSQDSADKFANRWNIPRRYSSYEALVADPDIDVIYIATPHSLHAENMQLCLNAGKHVLCEKPLTVNRAQAEATLALAREKKLFVMEAMWTKCQPAIQQALAWTAEGRIGAVRYVHAHFSYPIPYNPQGRLDMPELAGGSLLDMGVYPVSFAYFVLGKPDKILSTAHFNDLGVDELNSAIFSYKSGAQAVLSSSHRVFRPSEAFITGTKGFIKVDHMFLKGERLTMQIGAETEPITYDIPVESNGYIHQVREVHDCLRAGKLQSDILPHSHSLDVMEIMDQMRADWGLRYPFE